MTVRTSIIVALTVSLAGCTWLADAGERLSARFAGNGAPASTADTSDTGTTTTTTTADTSVYTTADTGITTSTGDTGTGDDCPVDPTTAPIGSATGYNLFVFGDYAATASDVGGTAAVGNDMTVSSYGTGSALPGTFSGVSLSVGNDLNYGNGQVFQGDVEVGGTFTNPGGFNVLNGTVTDGVATVFDAGDAEVELQDLSAYLDGLMATGTITEAYGQLTLSGTETDINVFDLDLDALTTDRVNTFTIDAPSSTVIINVSGATGKFLQNHGVFLKGGVAATDIILNFPGTTQLKVSASPVMGTILAPYADVDFTNTQMFGQLIAASVTGPGELHIANFDGDICIGDSDPGTGGSTGTTGDTGSTTGGTTTSTGDTGPLL